MAHRLMDSFGRVLDYLRISVTDRCNFRCVYCALPAGFSYLPKPDILSIDEIARVARVFLEMGGKKIRITGGEPLLRKDLVDLVRQLAVLPGLKILALTTNGYFLEKLAAPLQRAGLQHINVSIDSLKTERFAELTLCNQLEKVWRGVEESLSVGLKVKLNAVAIQGLNPDEILEFGQLAYRLPLEVRFIEYMPLNGAGWNPEKFLPLREVRENLQRHFTLIPMVRGSEVAQSYKIAGGKGTIGIIASMTEPFCERCSRLRLTSDGQLRPCLFSNVEIDLRSLLRAGGSDEEIQTRIERAVQHKPQGHGIKNPLEQSALSLPRIQSFGG